MAAGVGAGQSANAAVVVQDFAPPLDAQASIDVDLGGDAVPEFRIGVAINASFMDIGIKADEFAGTMFEDPPGSGMFTTRPGMAAVIMEGGLASNLAAGMLIGPGNTYETPFLTRLNGVDGDGNPVGNFNDASGFIGVQFELNGNTHYGYVGYEGDSGAGGDGRLFTIGWEDTPDTALFAGNVPPPTTADFDGDADVDGEDFLIWQRGVGLTGQTDNSNGDADGNGTVEGADLNLWTDQFGSGVAVGPAGAVPEPTSLALLAAGAAALTAYRRRKST
jgi:hypothetical protein